MSFHSFRDSVILTIASQQKDFHHHQGKGRGKPEEGGEPLWWPRPWVWSRLPPSLATKQKQRELEGRAETRGQGEERWVGEKGGGDPNNGAPSLPT